MTLTMLETAAAVIESLGGLSHVGKLTGSRYTAVANWKAAGAFPPRTYLLLTCALRDRGFEAPASLWNMQPKIVASEAAE